MTKEQLCTPSSSSAPTNPQMLDFEKSILEIQREFMEIITIDSRRGCRGKVF